MSPPDQDHRHLRPQDDRAGRSDQRVETNAEEALREARSALDRETARAHRLELEAVRLRRAVDQISQLIDVVERSERWRIGGFFVRLYNRLRLRRMGPDALEFMRRAVALPASVASARAALPRELEVFVGEELREHEERMTALYAETLSQMLQTAGLASPPLRPDETVPGRSATPRR